MNHPWIAAQRRIANGVEEVEAPGLGVRAALSRAWTRLTTIKERVLRQVSGRVHPGSDGDVESRGADLHRRSAELHRRSAELARHSAGSGNSPKAMPVLVPTPIKQT